MEIAEYWKWNRKCVEKESTVGKILQRSPG